MAKLTITQFAERVGVAVSTISRAVSSGRVTAGPDGLLDEAGALAQFDQNRRRRRMRRIDPALSAAAAAGGPGGGAPPGGAGSSGAFWDAKTRREVAEASLAELKEAEQRGELVRRAVVERELASQLVALRESLEVLADRLSAVLAAEPDAAACRALLLNEHRQCMRAFAERAKEQSAELRADASAAD